MNILTTRDTAILDGQRPVMLKGVNFGGWLMMEAYFTHAPNFAEKVFKEHFSKVRGHKTLARLERSFRANFITEMDMKTVAGLGMNCVRLPFNARLIERKPYQYDPAGFHYLDDAVGWAGKYGVRLILDLHAAPGSQNQDWHSDSLGKAGLWTSKENQKRVCALWEAVADRYKDEGAVAGYDLLNEAVVQDKDLLNRFYKSVIKAIRSADRRHILFIEGNRWAQDIDMLEDFADDHWAYSVHFYEPAEFTFHLNHFLKYPLISKAGRWDADVMRRRMKVYLTQAQARQRPVYVGEFGINAREGVYGEDIYLRDLLKAFNDRGFHWTYWTYKAVKNHMFPDGIYSYRPNSPWVNRQGPKSGWDTWAALWPKHQKDMIASWRTKAFTPNARILAELKKAV